MRPEHFEDARYAADLEHALKFDIEVDVVEEMGSELYAFFSVKSEALHSDDLDDLAEDAGATSLGEKGKSEAVARLSAESDAEAGSKTQLVLDTDKITLFDPDGKNLMRAGS